jgi:glycosyltransferase involved in cell wall biosynthesis
MSNADEALGESWGNLPGPPDSLHSSASRTGATRLGAVVPAYNEAGAIGRVVAEIRELDPAIDVVVVDDASTDDTAAIARAQGATVLRLPFNVGIGGAVQTGFRYVRDEGYDVAVRLDGDGQHDASELPKLLAPLERGEADLVVGSRFVAPGGAYRPPWARRIGIRVFARLVSLLGGQRVTDTTSGFLALDRVGIELFAAEYPHDYPEVEATLVALRSGLRLSQVQVEMRERETGSSSITFVRSIYYIVKVTLALLVASLRRYPRVQGESR